MWRNPHRVGARRLTRSGEWCLPARRRRSASAYVDTTRRRWCDVSFGAESACRPSDVTLTSSVRQQRYITCDAYYPELRITSLRPIDPEKSKIEGLPRYVSPVAAKKTDWRWSASTWPSTSRSIVSSLIPSLQSFRVTFAGMAENKVATSQSAYQQCAVFW